MSNFSDTELLDIGTTRGEIDYVALHRGIDPRGIRSGEMPPLAGIAADGQIGPTDFR